MSTDGLFGRGVCREDLPWPVLLPWISGADDDGAGAGLAPGWWRTSCPRKVAAAHGFGPVAAGVAGLIIEKHPEVALGRLLARLPTEHWVAEPGLLSVRARNVCSQEGISHIGDVASYSVTALGRLRGSGSVTVREIVTAAVDAVIRGPLGSSNTGNRAFGDDDVAGVKESETTLGEPDAEEAPGPQRADAVGEQQQFFAALAHREVVIARRRIFTTTPVTLAVVASTLGISAERVWQLATRMRRNWSERFGGETVTSDLVEAVCAMADPVAHLSILVRQFPALARTVPTVDVPLWRILAIMHPGLDATGDWIVAQGVDHAVRHAREVVTVQADSNGHARLDAIAEALHLAPGEVEVVDWLRRCGLYVDDDVVHTAPTHFVDSIPEQRGPRRFLKDRIAQQLRQSGKPMSIDELTPCLSAGTSRRGIAGALRRNVEFARVDKDRWGLVTWGMPTYTGIGDLIAGMLDERGGHLPIDELAKYVTDRYSVAERSVRHFASLPPFGIRDGIVSYHDARVFQRGQRKRQ